MYRCALLALALASAPLLSAAQVARNFPQNAWRGEITFANPPDILLNGKPARLAPGARLRGQNNMLLVSGAVQNQRLLAHYTIDTYGLVKDVWVLRPEEAAKTPWPRSAEEAAKLQFDPAAQTWSKP